MSVLNLLASYRFSRYYKIGFLFWDLVLLNLANSVSFLLRYGDFHLDQVKGIRTVSLLCNIVWFLLLLRKDSFRMIRVERIENILARTIQMLLVHVAIILTFIFVLDYDEISRLRLIYFYTIFFVLLVIFRIVFMKLLKYVRAQGYNFRKVVIVGANEMGERMNRFLSKDLTNGYKVVGFFDDECDGTLIQAPLLGGFADVSNYLREHKVDELYVSLHIDKIEEINKLTLLCEHYMVRIRYIPDFQQYTKTNRVEVSFYGNTNTPVLMLRKEPLEINVNRIIKKLFDLGFSLLLIVLVFSWLFPILAILIKIDSRGPVFFVQKRSGRNNTAFKCFKFRTMYVNDTADKLQASQNDARITKVGVFLRHTSMDEFPQFFNVLLGDMSVVGPRPHMLAHTERYSDLINNFLVRQYAKPGITGWAQVNGFRGETKELADMKGRVEHDIWYIENWSFLLDLKIIWRTVVNAFQGEEKAF